MYVGSMCSYLFEPCNAPRYVEDRGLKEPKCYWSERIFFFRISFRKKLPINFIELRDTSVCLLDLPSVVCWIDYEKWGLNEWNNILREEALHHSWRKTNVIIRGQYECNKWKRVLFPKLMYQTWFHCRCARWR